jgi:hypothetical protein
MGAPSDCRHAAGRTTRRPVSDAAGWPDAHFWLRLPAQPERRGKVAEVGREGDRRGGKHTGTVSPRCFRRHLTKWCQHRVLTLVSSMRDCKDALVPPAIGTCWKEATLPTDALKTRTA